MKFSCVWAKQNKISLVQMVSFALGKLFIGLVELPQYQKQISYILLLIFSFLFYLAAFVLKLALNGRPILKTLLVVNIRMFLIWMVSILSMVFSFSLCRSLNWGTDENISVLLCQIFQTATLVMLCHWRYISKGEFIVYELILSINILVLGIKTVIFIEYEKDSPHKDIVLLNLTTQIALAILEMDAIDRAYSRHCKSKGENTVNKTVELELTMNT